MRVFTMQTLEGGASQIETSIVRERTWVEGEQAKVAGWGQWKEDRNEVRGVSQTQGIW